MLTELKENIVGILQQVRIPLMRGVFDTTLCDTVCQ
jgi:hypothetical protein